MFQFRSNPIPVAEEHFQTYAGTSQVGPSQKAYRGISLQSVVMGVFCSILNARLGEYLEENQLLVEEQNGFRKEC